MIRDRFIVGAALLVFCLVSSTVGATIPSSERAALVAFYNATGGSNWDHNDGWLGPVGTECDWWGIWCYGDHVIELVLLDNNLTGSIPPEIGQLTELEILMLYRNDLLGDIPSAIGGMDRLRYFEIGGNENLDPGPVPGFLRYMPNLEAIGLSATGRTGDMPAWIGELGRLNYLGLGNNSFNLGEIPSSYAGLTNLGSLYLRGSRRTGPIPAWIGNLTGLWFLSLGGNPFDSGPLPGSFSQLVNLEDLWMDSARLTGSIPSWIGQLGRLETLSLDYNELSGPVPSQLGTLSQLRTLYLHNNNLTGPLPDMYAGMPDIGYLSLRDNQFSPSPFPPSLRNAENLRYVILDNLNGTIPSWIGELTSLWYLRLLDGHLSGLIPSSIGSLTDLRYLRLNDNDLVGEIPSTMLNLTELANEIGLDICGNGLSTSNTQLRNFLNSKQTGGDWEGCQTGGGSQDPVADFSWAPLWPLTTAPVSFSDQSSNSPTSWSWNFGDGGSSSSRNPSHTFSSADSYQVTLTASNSHGSDSVTKTVTVAAGGSAPDANFGWTPSSPEAGESVSFSDQSSNSPTSWSWNFGDGGSSSSRNPSHTFSSTGSYQVTLTASNSHGSDSVTKTVTVAAGGSAPDANFGWTPSSPEAGESVGFSDQSSNSPTSWSWSFGDGGSSSSRNPSHTFTSAGTYPVELAATNAYGSDSVSKNVTVSAAPPGNTITIGGVTFAADSVNVTNSGYRLEGVASINNVLQYEGTLELKNPVGGSDQFLMQGEGQITMPGVTVPGIGALVVYDGSFSFPFLGGEFFDIPEIGTEVKVAGWVVKIEDLGFDADGIEISGAISIPQYAPGWPNVYAAAQMRISEANGLELLGGELDIDKIQLYGAFSLEGLHVSYDRATNSFEGEGELKTAAFGLKVGVEIIDSCPNGVTITVTQPQVNIPNTPLALANYGIEATGFCPTYDFGIGLHTDITILGLPDPDLLSFADLYVMYYPLTTLSGGGKVRFLKVDLASADFYVNDGANGCAGGVCFRTILGLPSLEEPWILGQTDMSIMADPLEFTGTQSMTVQIPDVDDLPAFARTIAFACCGGDYPCAIGEAAVASRVTPSGDPIGEFNARVSTCLFGLAADLTVTYGESGDDEFHFHFFEDGEMVKLTPASQGLAASSTEVQVPDGTTDAYFLAEAQNSITPEFAIVDPDGVRYDGEGGVGIAYVEDNGNYTVMFGAENPTPGTWSLEVSNLAPNNVELTVYTLGGLTAVEVLDVSPDGADVRVSWRTIGNTPGGTVDLLYCNAFDGPPTGMIAGDLAATGTQQTTTWDTLVVPAGVYYIRARTANGQSQHTFGDPIVVRNASAPQPPVNLQGSTAGASAAVLVWQRSSSPTTSGYVVSVRQGAASQPVEYAVGNVTSYRVEDLHNSAGYEIWVSAYDASGVRSEPSNLVRLSWSACDLSCSTTAPAVAGRGDPVQFGSTVTSIGCAGEPSFDWAFGDGASGNESNPRHSYLQSDTFGWSFTVLQDGVSCGSTGVISVEDHSCTLTLLSPGGSVPVNRGETGTVAWAAAGGACSPSFDVDLYRFGSFVEPLVEEAVGSNFAWMPSSELDLGDGYQIRIRDHENLSYEGFSASFALGEGGMASPGIASAGTEVCMIPAAAHVGGVGDTQWVSDVVLNNPGETASNVNVYFLPRSRDNRNAAGRRMTVPPGQARRLDDIVARTFGQESAAGALLVGSSAPLVVTSRIYNDSDSGTFGQFVPGGSANEALGEGDEARLIQLTKNADYRTNIGFANAGDQLLDVEVDLFRANRGFIDRKSYSLPPYGSFQANGIFEVNVADAYAVVSSSTSSAEYFTYASIVDNLSADSVYVTPVDEVSGEAIYVPGVAHADGAGGTRWRTDLEVHNPSSIPVSFTVELLRRDQPNNSPPSGSYSLGAGSSRRFSDVVGSEFGVATSGAIRVTPVSGALSVTSRTFNDVASGTFGQFIGGLPVSAGITRGMTARISQLEGSAQPNSGFRTNIGFVNAGSIRTEVEIQLFDGYGDSLGSIDLSLRPFEFRQINDVFDEVGAGSVANGYAVVRTDTHGGRFFTYGSVVDNRSGDPIYIPGIPSGESALSAPTTAPVLTVSASSSSRIDVSWTAVSDATGYRLYRGSTLVQTGSNRSFADTGLNAGTRYCYSVRAFNAVGDGPNSTTQCVTTQTVTPPQSAPSLTAAAASTSRIDLSWSQVTAATGYRLFRGSTVIYEGAGRSYADSSLAAGTEYCYTVRAFNGGGDGPDSSRVCATTQPAAPACGSWEWITNGATNQHLYGVAWGAGQFVAVGTGGAIVTSPDGITWTARTSGTQEFLVRVAHGGGRFVAVGNTGTVVTSEDGVVWTLRYVATNQNLVDVAWVNGMFVATGTGGMILKSPDGLTWSPVPDGTDYVLNGTSWTGSHYVIAGSRSDFSDGILLVGESLSSLSVWPDGLSVEGALFGVASQGNGSSVAVGKDGGILSIDPSDSVPTTVVSPTTRDLYAIAAQPGRYTAVGSSGTVITSANGMNWTTEASGVSRHMYGIAFGDGVNVSVGQAGTTIRQECGR